MISNKKTRVERLERERSPGLENGGIIVHERDETQEEQQRLLRDYPEGEGYRHITFKPSAEDPDLLDICITDGK